MSLTELTSTERFESLITKDHRYQPEAYTFVFEALDWTLKTIICDTNTPDRHVSVEDLLEGIRQSAIHKFGPFAKMVFSEWGVNHTEDWGEIVFNLIDYDLLGKQESDRKEDFEQKFDFKKAFNLNPDFKYDKRKNKWKVTYQAADQKAGIQNRN